MTTDWGVDLDQRLHETAAVQGPLKINVPSPAEFYGSSSLGPSGPLKTVKAGAEKLSSNQGPRTQEQRQQRFGTRASPFHYGRTGIVGLAKKAEKERVDEEGRTPTLSGAITRSSQRWNMEHMVN